MSQEWFDAARAGDAAALKSQLDAGADHAAADEAGETALMLAAHHGHLAAVLTLIAAGADVNAMVDEDAPLGNLNLRGATPLDLARLMREDALAEALERAGGKATDLIENLKRQLKQAPTPP